MGNLLVFILEIVLFGATIKGGSNSKGGRIFAVVVTVLVLVLAAVTIAKNSSVS